MGRTAGLIDAFRLAEAPRRERRAAIGRHTPTSIATSLSLVTDSTDPGVNRIIDVYADVMASGDERLFRRIVLYYLTKSTSFPRPFEVAARFAGREKDVAETLHPMLLTRDKPLLESMIRPLRSSSTTSLDRTPQKKTSTPTGSQGPTSPPNSSSPTIRTSSPPLGLTLSRFRGQPQGLAFGRVV